MQLETYLKALVAKPGFALILLASLPWYSVQGADIKQRTLIICVSQDIETLISVPGYRGSSDSDKVISSFTQWMFEADKEPSPSQIRFLWVPYTSASPSELKISTTDTNHSVIHLLSQTRHGVLAATSASSRLTNIGWMFAINFKAEQVVATQVFSNFGGGRGRVYSYSCRFDNQVPAGED